MTYLRNVWYVAAWSREIGDVPISRTICKIPLVLYRAQSGAIVALDNRCPHRYAPLSRGKRIGDEIQCGYHGLRFGPDGADSIPSRSRTSSFFAPIPTVQ